MAGSARPGDKSGLRVIGQKTLHFRARETHQIESRRQSEVRLAPLGRVLDLPLCCESVSVCSQSVTSCWKRNVILTVRSRKPGHGLVARRGLHHRASDRVTCFVRNYAVYFGIGSSQRCGRADCRQEHPQEFLHDGFHFSPPRRTCPEVHRKTNPPVRQASDLHRSRIPSQLRPVSAERPPLGATLETLISHTCASGEAGCPSWGPRVGRVYTQPHSVLEAAERPTLNPAHRPSLTTAGPLRQTRTARNGRP